MDRRKFIKQTGQAVGLAAITGATGFLFHNRETTDYKPVLDIRTNFQVAPDPLLPKLALARHDDPIAALMTSLDAVGGIRRFIKPGDKVTVKPNAGWDRAPEQAANSNPILIGEIARLCFSAGASQVIVTDVTCNDPRRCFIRSGIREAAEKAGAKLLLASDDDFVDVNFDGEVLTVWPVLRHFVECDKLINVPIVKHHSLSNVTIGMKNLYGIIGGRRNQLHQKIDQSIVDLATFATPTLTIVDATRVLLRSGPQGGSLDDVAIENSVICATDQVAADARGAEFLGHTADQIGHIMLAEKSGLGIADYKAAGYAEFIS